MSVDDVQLDVLVSGEEPDRRRRVAVAAVLAVVLVLAAAGWYADHRSRRGEFAAVSRCSQQVAGAVADSSRVQAMSEYVRPSLIFAPERTAQKLYGLIATEAREVGPGLQQARDACAAITVPAWHSPQRSALAAQLAYLDAERHLLADTADDGRAYFADQTQLSGLRTAAASALAAARPGDPW